MGSLRWEKELVLRQSGCLLAPGLVGGCGGLQGSQQPTGPFQASSSEARTSENPSRRGLGQNEHKASKPVRSG